MKKLFLISLFVFFVSACSTVGSINQAANCQYQLMGVEISDFTLDSMTANVSVAIINKSKTTAAQVNRFVGKLYIDNKPVSDISFGQYHIEPLSSEIANATLTLSIAQVGKNVVGLVMANSISIKYKVVGTMYFDTPVGELPLPVVFAQKEN